MDFLAFLVPNLWQNNPKYLQIFGDCSGISLIHIRLFLSFASKMLFLAKTYDKIT